MRVLVAGAGRIGTKILSQLKKNPDIEILTVDPRKYPFAVKEGVISKVDFHQALTSIALEHVIEKVNPDLVLVTTTTEDIGLGNAPGIDIFVESLREELASISRVPIIAVARINR
jgi:nucleoside-diphosphate-sugar epimerase